MDPGIQVLLDFVEGRSSVIDFEKEVYQNPHIERVLSADPNLRANNYIGKSVYLWLLEKDFHNLSDQLNIHGAIVEFLDRNGFSNRPASAFSNKYELILKAQPKWLDVDIAYIEGKMLGEAGELQGNALRTWLKSEFKRRFRFVSKPPRWICSPEWPIGDNGPLVFLGQVNLPDYFHDEASVYVFHDTVTGVCETIIQVH